MNVLDYILIAILLIFVIRGFVRGLINEIFGFGSFIIPLLLGILFYQKMGAVFAPSMNLIVANVLGFLVVFICAFVLIKIIQLLVKTIFSGPILNSLDKTLGLLMGFAEGGALVFLILVFLSDLGEKLGANVLLEGSRVFEFVERTWSA